MKIVSCCAGLAVFVASFGSAAEADMIRITYEYSGGDSLLTAATTSFELPEYFSLGPNDRFQNGLGLIQGTASIAFDGTPFGMLPVYFFDGGVGGFSYQLGIFGGQLFIGTSGATLFEYTSADHGTARFLPGIYQMTSYEYYDEPNPFTGVTVDDRGTLSIAVIPSHPLPVIPEGSDAVPEPATWAMMIGGFGMIGGAMRRRRRVAVRYA